MSSRNEREARIGFAQRYGMPTGEANARIERDVIGAVWGANGYTTLRQVEELRRRLRIDSASRVLDVGTGRGWPGLYFATETGCSVVGTDAPLEGLRIAVKRARSEGLEGRAALVAAAGAQQPFRAGSFDAVVHTDVLC